MNFYEENRVFSGLIKYFANKLNYKDSDFELWSFLWLVKHQTQNEKPHKYYAVCLRNEYIRLSKEQSRNFEELTLDDEEIETEISNFDFEISLFEDLTKGEKELFNALKTGYTITDYAKIKGVSRQSINQTKKRIKIKAEKILVS